MGTIFDLSDRTARKAVAHGWHIVKGVPQKHIVEANSQVKIQVGVGWASFYDRQNSIWRCRGWKSLEHLYYQGFEIPADNFHFHSGGPADAADAYFPDDIAHPGASYYSALLPQGMNVDNEPDQMVGIFKTTQTADYDEDGHQIQEDGSALGMLAADDYCFWSTKPALHIVDTWRRTRRQMLKINWPVYSYWRDYCATLINWDDGALTPHHVFLTNLGGGTLAAATYWVRVATLKGGDISSASKDRATDGFSTASITVGASGKFRVEWTSQIDRGATGYRVYVGTAEGAEDRYFVVAAGATNTLDISTLAGATMGAPPEVATAGLIRQIPRFQSNLFFQPPFDFITALDRYAQITCMDFRYSGALLELVAPEIQLPVFTLNLAEIGNASFKTYKTDRRQRPNQIVVNGRDLDDPYFAAFDPPIEINRFDLQAKEGVRPFYIDIGVSNRSQAQRVGEYWGRRLIDANQMIELEGSPKSYFVLPADAVKVTHDVPGWEDAPFIIESKEEPEDTKAGYPMTGRIYNTETGYYSDTDHSPFPKPLPAQILNRFAEPPVVSDLTLSEQVVETTTGDAFEVIRGLVTFADFVGKQRGRVWVKAPSDGAYRATEITVFPDADMHASFDYRPIEVGLNHFKVVTESDPFGVYAALGTHPEFTLNVTGDLLKGPEPTDLLGTFYPDTGDLLMDWIGVTGKGASKREIYDLQISVPGDGDFSTVREVTIDRAVQQMASFIPWEFDSDDGGGGTSFELVAPGGFNATVHPGGDPHWIALRSAVKAFIYDELIFQFEIAAGFAMPFKIGIVPYDEDPDTSEYGLWWGVGTNYVYGDAQPDGEVISEPAIDRTWITADGTEVHPILAGNRPAIAIGRDRIPRFVLNYENGHSVPVLTSARKVKVPGYYRAYAYMTESAAVRNANWLRSVPEFVYNAGMERADNSALLPDEIKWRVRQHSFYTSGPPSDWVEETSNR
jgi:hypothetical protein